jgi:nicotinate-nucleotide adenylyltransferase
LPGKQALYSKTVILNTVIFGGTFNPPHIGHLRMAQEVAFVHNMDRVVFVPTYLPPHKSSIDIAEAPHRLKMTRLACRKNDIFEVSDLEIKRGGPSFTVNTLEELQGVYGPDMYFLMGTDSLADIQTWKDHERIFDLSSFIVVSRPGMSFGRAWEQTPGKIKSKYRPIDNGYERVDIKQEIINSQVKGLDVSATKIRRLIMSKVSARYLVTDDVLEYILSNKVYEK